MASLTTAAWQPAEGPLAQAPASTSRVRPGPAPCSPERGGPCRTPVPSRPVPALPCPALPVPSRPVPSLRRPHPTPPCEQACPTSATSSGCTRSLLGSGVSSPCACSLTSRQVGRPPPPHLLPAWHLPGARWRLHAPRLHPHPRTHPTTHPRRALQRHRLRQFHRPGRSARRPGAHERSRHGRAPAARHGAALPGGRSAPGRRRRRGDATHLVRRGGGAPRVDYYRGPQQTLID